MQRSPSRLKAPRTPEEDTCIALNKHGKRCRRKPSRKNGLCKLHEQIAAAKAAGTYDDSVGSGGTAPDPSANDLSKAGLTTSMRRKQRQVADGELTVAEAFGYPETKQFVLTEQARDALKKLGAPLDAGKDPKLTLLSMVSSAHHQAQIWEAMLMSVPDSDWELVGTPPIPGIPATAGGARIEVIQKHLSDATAKAARISDLAIKAGIAERMVRLAEEQSMLIADTVRAATIAAIGTLRLPAEAEKAAIDAALGAAAYHLRALAAGDKPILDGIAVNVSESPLELT
jgi:hypothetical protein